MSKVGGGGGGGGMASFTRVQDQFYLVVQL